MIMRKKIFSAIGGKNKKGFSFLEVMISVFVLSVGITAVMELMSSNILNSIGSRDATIAAELAQEGIELTRNIRDNNFITDPSEPFDDLDNGICSVDYDDVDVSSPGVYLLNHHNTGGFYTHSSGAGITATKFYRKIDIIGYGSPEIGKKITSTVIWGGNSFPTPCTLGSKCVYAEDVLTDWHN